eukprot:3529519-Pleurochrysis_carterae.AAC.5
MQPSYSNPRGGSAFFWGIYAFSDLLFVLFVRCCVCPLRSCASAAKPGVRAYLTSLQVCGAKRSVYALQTAYAEPTLRSRHSYLVLSLFGAFELAGMKRTVRQIDSPVVLQKPREKRGLRAGQQC